MLVSTHSKRKQTMKFERKPIQPNPTCAMCGKPIKVHTSEEIKNCMKERRISKL